MQKIFGAALLLASSCALAQETTNETTTDAPVAGDPAVEAAPDAEGPRFGVGVHAGTGGLGIDVAYGLNRWIDLRAGYNFGSYSGEQEEDGIDYDGEIKISAAKLMVDLKPFAGGFRISAGVYTGSPELDLNAKSRSTSEEFEIGDRIYRGDGLALDGGIDLGSTAPYLGIGWGGTTNGRGLGVSFDLGVLFTKSPDVSLLANGRVCDATEGDCDPVADGFDVNGGTPEADAFQAQLADEVANIEDDAKDFKLWPVLNLGLHYRF